MLRVVAATSGTGVGEQFSPVILSKAKDLWLLEEEIPRRFAPRDDKTGRE